MASGALFLLRAHYAELYFEVARTWKKRDARIPAPVALVADRYTLDRRPWHSAFASVHCLSELLARSPALQPDRRESLLRAIDDETGGQFWQLLLADRSLARMDYRCAVDRAAALYLVLSRLLEEQRPPLVVACETALFYEMLTVQMCRRRRITVRCPTSARLPYHRIALVDNIHDQWVGLREAYARCLAALEEADRAAVNAWTEDVVVRGCVPVYKRADRTWSSALTRVRELRRLPEYVVRTSAYLRRDRAHAHYQWPPTALDKVRRTLRYYRDRLRKDFVGPVPGERFFLFPLQVYPEISVSLLAPFMCDQAHVVENLAKSLPPSSLLYCKENEGALGWRPPGFYERLRALPNVRLISPFTPIHPLIRRSLGVITISSTTGLEAILHGRPVVLLGRACYEVFEEVFRVEGFQELGAVLRRLEREPFLYTDRRYAFLAAFLTCTFSGQIYAPFFMPYTLSAENVFYLSELLALQFESAAAGAQSPAAR